ncbi:antitoxin Xre-like helix-turn-helix domain-containing protein [Mucilaginibacter sp.]|uniref:type II RES/Xre toxin-antitoxin system antitoxin n=1 Tax=Mucilaginibacter sp. TaxID=1882438 RepID=UPI0026331957|nr:antitoxin Xre-like helix-turn-helix domain-containing protein [Mucilaginibacter sp.]
MSKEKLYKHPEEDSFDLTNMVREGVPFPYFNNLSNQIHFGLEEWSSYLHLSERTIQRYKKENKSFDPLYSERILEIELLYKKGIVVFGVADNFYTWMDTISIPLGSVKPKDLLDTGFGIEAIYDELGRIEFGVLA